MADSSNFIENSSTLTKAITKGQEEDEHEEKHKEEHDRDKRTGDLDKKRIEALLFEREKLRSKKLFGRAGEEEEMEMEMELLRV
jgi:hypothetical protein